MDIDAQTAKPPFYYNRWFVNKAFTLSEASAILVAPAIGAERSVQANNLMGAIHVDGTKVGLSCERRGSLFAQRNGISAFVICAFRQQRGRRLIGNRRARLSLQGAGGEASEPYRAAQLRRPDRCEDSRLIHRT